MELGTPISDLPDYGVRAVSQDGRLQATATARYVTTGESGVLATNSTILICNIRPFLEVAQPPGEADSKFGHFLPFN